MSSHWYLAPGSSQPAFNPATSAFEEGLQIFKTKLTTDPNKRARTLKAAKLQDVLDEVSNAQSQYEAKHSGSKTRECIVAFSKRVHYYGKVMDVMVQQHPEYASLAWGAMKIVFGSIVEHEKLGVIIVNAMCDIADALSRVELAETLYPTPVMKQTIALLYAYTIKFLLRALEWYETSTVSRALQSITRPAALRYDDLIQDIQKASGKVSELSLAGSQAEQRDMHNKLRDVHKEQKGLHTQLQTRFEEMQRQMKDLTALIQQANQSQILSEKTLALHIQETILMSQTISASQVDIRHKLSDIQLTQALSFISLSCPIDHKASYEHALIIRQTRKFSTQTKCSPFWISPVLQTWDNTSSSSLITLKATFRDRLNIRDFCTNLIEQVLRSRVAVLWILKSPRQPANTVFDILKSLIHQALTFDNTSHTDTILAFHLRKFQVAHSVQDYVNILGELLEHFTLVYFIIDIVALSSESIDECQQLMRKLLQEFADRGAKTVIKVMVVDYRPGGLAETLDHEKVLRIGRTAQRKGKRIPTEPLRGRARRLVHRGRTTDATTGSSAV